MNLLHGDCLEVMQDIPDNSIDLIATDPPYYKVKSKLWDWQWDTPAEYLDWVGKLCEQWERILKPNGSLYVFASPRMAARVEVTIGQWFEVLNSIRWTKEHGWHKKVRPSDLRGYLMPHEHIIFVQHYNSDSYAKGESGYGHKIDELRGFVFEPLRAYLDGERRRAGIDFEQVRKIVNCAPKSGLPSHWFTKSQWMLPTADNYQKLHDGFNKQNSQSNGNDAYLKREYEDLKREYEDLRRPFNVTADVPYTDVWTFNTVSYYPDKHPAEKPVALMEHIVKTSSRRNATVLDCFMGSGTTGVACVNTGRQFIGIELEREYYDIACERITIAENQKKQETMHTVRIEVRRAYELPTM